MRSRVEEACVTKRAEAHPNNEVRGLWISLASLSAATIVGLENTNLRRDRAAKPKARTDGTVTDET